MTPESRVDAICKSGFAVGPVEVVLFEVVGRNKNGFASEQSSDASTVRPFASEKRTQVHQGIKQTGTTYGTHGLES